MISAVSRQGKVRFMIYQDTMTRSACSASWSRLVRASEQKVSLILDNLKVHHGKLVAAWLETHKDKYLNHALKFFVLSGQPPYTIDDI